MLFPFGAMPRLTRLLNDCADDVLPGSCSTQASGLNDLTPDDLPAVLKEFTATSLLHSSPESQCSKGCVCMRLYCSITSKSYFVSKYVYRECEQDKSRGRLQSHLVKLRCKIRDIICTYDAAKSNSKKSDVGCSEPDWSPEEQPSKVVFRKTKNKLDHVTVEFLQKHNCFDMPLAVGFSADYQKLAMLLPCADAARQQHSWPAM